ncbi:hypothetical protein AnigIFM50267_008633 [Aspergillus niger]|nr:hypothetical protein AnigIFM50267_008633 [Aspergillus niger]
MDKNSVQNEDMGHTLITLLSFRRHPPPTVVNSNSDGHVSEDESSPQTENVQDLKAQVAFLRDQLEILQGKASLDLELQMKMLTAGAKGWSDFDFEVLGNMIHQLMYRIKNWCQQHVRQGLPDTAELSGLEKQAITRSLEGYWVQDVEWDTLMKSLPYSLSNIVEKFFVNPFWYLEGEEFNQQDKATGSVSCAQNLQHLYQRFLETNGIRATIWKKETVRLSNSVMLTQAPNLELGRQTKEYRTKAVALFASTLLSDPFFQRLLESVDCEEAKKRENSLIHTGECGNTFDPRSNEATLHELYNVGGNADDARLAGRRILGITQPVVILKLRTLRSQENVLNKAELLVEYGDYTEEDHVRDRPKPAENPDEEVEKEED